MDQETSHKMLLHTHTHTLNVLYMCTCNDHTHAHLHTWVASRDEGKPIQHPFAANSHAHTHSHTRRGAGIVAAWIYEIRANNVLGKWRENCYIYYIRTLKHLIWFLMLHSLQKVLSSSRPTHARLELERMCASDGLQNLGHASDLN